jgi:G-protein alpha subunit
MEDLGRIAALNYSATDEDILDASSSSNENLGTCETCIVHLEAVEFHVTCVSLSLLDQHALEGLDKPHVVAFVASLTGFDQTHGEEGVNKMMRSIGSLRSLCGIVEAMKQQQHASASEECATTCVILTKPDLFVEKMRYSDVAAIADFDDFEGESGDADGALDYFIDKFQSCLPNRSDDLVVSFDAETDDVATILLGYTTKRFRGPALSKGPAVVATQSTGKAPSVVAEPTMPSPAIEVTFGDSEEFYTESIEV